MEPVTPRDGEIHQQAVDEIWWSFSSLGMARKQGLGQLGSQERPHGCLVNKYSEQSLGASVLSETRHGMQGHPGCSLPSSMLSSWTTEPGVHLPLEFNLRPCCFLLPLFPPFFLLPPKATSTSPTNALSSPFHEFTPFILCISFR